MLELGLHSEIYPEAQVTERVAVRVQSIDSCMADNAWNRLDYNYVSLDIQGYELEALKGMELQLGYVDYIYTEVNTREVYKDSALLSDVERYLGRFGYKRVAQESISSQGGAMRSMQERG